MKHLPDRVNFPQQTALIRSLPFVCLTLHRRSMRGIMLLLLLSAYFPLCAQLNIQWDKDLGGNSWDQLSSLQPTNDGGYILGGASDSGISGNKTQASRGVFDYWIVKLDSAGNKQWDKTLGGSQRDELTVLRQTLDGGFILGGFSFSDISGDKTQANRGENADYADYWVVKLDAAGNQQWDKTIGGSGSDYLYSLQQTSDGGYILGGASESGIGGDKTQVPKGATDYWVVKLDAAGNKQWDKTIGGNSHDFFRVVQQTSDGGYILGGDSHSGISGDKTQANRGENADYADYWVVKLDAAGNQQWDKTIGGDKSDYLSALHQTSDGGFILGGSSESSISGDKTEDTRALWGNIYCSPPYQCSPDYWVVKLDAAGNKQWDKTIGGNSDDFLRTLQQTSDGGYILAGESLSHISGDKTQPYLGYGDYWLVGLDAAGNKTWDKTIGGDVFDNLSALQPTSDGGFMLGGWSLSNISWDKTQDSKGSYDFWIVKLTPLPVGARVTGFTLIDSDTGQRIRALDDGETINLAELPTQKLNIRANAHPEKVGSVLLELSGQQTSRQVDNELPYALFGDAASKDHAWSPALGSYTLTATPYTQPDGQGTAGTPLTVHFTLVSKQASPLVEWNRTIGGNGTEWLEFLQETSEGGYILGGRSDSEISGDKTQASKGEDDYWLVKLDAAGNKIWDKTIGGDKSDYLSALQQTSDGGYILGGYSYSEISGDKTQASKGYFDIWVVKLDAAGNQQWDRTIGGSQGDFLEALQQTSDGGYILGGVSESDIGDDKTQDSKGDSDYWVVKLDAAGNKIWDKTIGGDGPDYLSALQQTGDGGYILGGTSLSGLSGDKTEDNKGIEGDFWVVKLDAAGNQQWDKTIGGNYNDDLNALQRTSDGGYILAGESESDFSGDKTQANRGFDSPDYWVVKLDAAGNKQWDKTLGGTDQDVLYALQPTGDGGYILGGYSKSDIGGEKTQAKKGADADYGDYWVVKLDAAGNKQWDKTLGGSGSDYLFSLQQTGDGGFILGGASESDLDGDKSQASKGSLDYWVVKLGPFHAEEQQRVKSFTLINTESEQPIRTLQDGDNIDLADLPTRKLNIRADTHPDTVGSVLFELSGQQTWTHVENEVPYALFADIRGDYEKWFPAPGSYTLTATPYPEPDAQGEAGTPLTIRFTIRPPQLVGFTLINTQSEQPIRSLQDKDTLNLANLPKKLNIRADTHPGAVGSVAFALSGQQDRTYQDNAAPYALFGDVKGDYNKWFPAPGSYSLTATPYTERDAKGHSGTPLTIHFTVVSKPAATLAARMEQAPGAARAEWAANLTLYPNPTPDGRLQAQLSGQVHGQVRFSLFSSVGKKLAEGTITQAVTPLELDFSGQLRAPGLYYLRLEGAGVQQVLRIMRK